jgi:hypothetical protein
MDQVNYTAQKAWKALHFVFRVLKTGNSYFYSYVSSVLCILFHSVVLCIVSVKMCAVLLPPGVNPIVVKEIYHIISVL